MVSKAGFHYCFVSKKLIKILIFQLFCWGFLKFIIFCFGLHISVNGSTSPPYFRTCPLSYQNYHLHRFLLCEWQMLKEKKFVLSVKTYFRHADDSKNFFSRSHKKLVRIFVTYLLTFWHFFMAFLTSRSVESSSNIFPNDENFVIDKNFY